MKYYPLQQIYIIVCFRL